MASKARLATLIPIKNMNRALRFYTKVLGGELLYRGEGEMKDGWASLKLATQDIWLIAPEKRESRKLAYTTFLVDNIEGFVSGLVKKGVKFDKPMKMSKETKIKGPVAYDSMGAAAFFKDTEGNLFMVWQGDPSM
ncbi:MAG: VOC family protein [Thermoplasmata archaeon]|nr:VOC family protein [Thermoplasmata archaeon]